MNQANTRLMSEFSSLLPSGDLPDDDMWKKLLDPSVARARIKAAHKSAEAKYDGMPTEQYNYLRRCAKNDLFFLTSGVLGYSALTASLHGHTCKWMSNTQGDQFRLILEPRGHFKTTVTTIGDSTQIVLPDDAGTAIHPRNLGPDARILLAHETKEGASRFNYEITGHFTANPTLMGLFPECVPSPRHQRMNKSELELPRSFIRAEPTFDTMGVGGKSQGRHYDFFKLDDIFGDKARDSAAERETTIQWFDNIQAFAVDLSKVHMDLPGTRYSLDDIYAHAMDVYGGQLKRYIRRIEEIQPIAGYNKTCDCAICAAAWENVDERGVGKLPIFPERYPPHALNILRKNKKVWSSQYVNDPVEGLAKFDPTHMRLFDWVGGTGDRVRPCFTDQTYNVRDLDIILFCDPALTGKPGLVLTGVSHNLNIFVLDTFKWIQGEEGPTEFVDRVFRIVQRWWPRLVTIEQVAFSILYKHWMESEMKRRGCSFRIEPYVPPQAKVKAERVMGLEPYFKAGQIFFHESQSDLIKEYKEFGATSDYHMLDALAQGPDFWRPGLERSTYEENARIAEEIASSRDWETGY